MLSGFTTLNPIKYKADLGHEFYTNSIDVNISISNDKFVIAFEVEIKWDLKGTEAHSL